MALFNLQGNYFNGPIPQELTQCTKLVDMWLYNNYLNSTLPRNIGDLQKLVSFNVHLNALTGTLPESLYSIPTLLSINVAYNLFKGKISQSIDNLSELKTIYLQSNGFTGPIPDSIGNLQKLVMLAYYGNPISGTIPESFGNLTSLSNLSGGETKQTGTIPESLTGMTNLETINIQGVPGLSGTLPACLGMMPNLKFIHISESGMSGKIPDLSMNTALTSLNLNNNALTGTVPASVGISSVLTTLQLANNSLTSDPIDNFHFVDPTLQQSITTIDISGNRFTGSIPEKVFGLNNLVSLVLSTNCYEKSLPSNICNISTFETLILSGLSSAPSCRDYFWDTTVLAADFNGFEPMQDMTGALPSCILQNNPKLQIYYASGNGFTGQLSDLPDTLQKLDLSHNYLTGALPPSIGQMTKLNFLDLSNNRIDGDLKAFNQYNGSSAFELHLDINRISGSIPVSLTKLETVDILNGNVLECISDTVLPAADPDRAKYVCGSNSLNTAVYKFLAVAVIFLLLMGIVAYRAKKSTANNGQITVFYAKARAWLSMLEEDADCFTKTTQSRMYASNLLRIRRFALWSTIALTVLLLIYFSLSQTSYSTIAHRYLWSTTAVYFEGYTPTVILMVCFLVMLVLVRFMAMKDQRDNKVIVEEGEGKMGDLSLFCDNPLHAFGALMRLLLITVLLIGTTMIVNGYYVYIQLNGTAAEQSQYSNFLSIFNIAWVSVGIPLFLNSPYFMFGIPSATHDSFLTILCGGKITAYFIFTVFITLIIPVLTTAAVNPDCFQEVFEQGDMHYARYGLSVCTCLNAGSDGKEVCSKHGTMHYGVAVLPGFIYNYTCSANIIKSYAPIYMGSYAIQIFLAMLQALYILNSDLSREDESTNAVRHAGLDDGRYTTDEATETVGADANPSLFQRIGELVGTAISLTLPSPKLLWDKKKRRKTFEADAAKPDKLYFADPVCSEINLATSMGILSVLLTFGTLSPLLGFVAVITLVCQTGTSQLLIGSFILRETAGQRDYNEKPQEGKFQTAAFAAVVVVSPMQHLEGGENEEPLDMDAPDAREIVDVQRYYSCTTSMELVEEDCTSVPPSVIARGRKAILFSMAFFYSFILVDIAGAAKGGSGTFWIPLVMFGTVVLSEVFPWIQSRYAKRKEVVTSSARGVEM